MMNTAGAGPGYLMLQGEYGVIPVPPHGVTCCIYHPYGIRHSRGLYRSRRDGGPRSERPRMVLLMVLLRVEWTPRTSTSRPCAAAAPT